MLLQSKLSRVKASSLSRRTCRFSSSSVAPQRVALVTGGSRGIGKAICESLILQNYRVGVVSSSEKCKETAEYLNKKVGRRDAAVGVQCDVSNLISIPAAVKEVEAALGPVDVLVNNAGITMDSVVLRINDEEMQKVMKTNLMAPIAFSREVSKSMLRRKVEGDIVMIGSLVGGHGNFGQVVYAATKAGLEGATKSLALELGKKGIRTNLIAPGFVDTDMTKNLPLGHTTAESETNMRQKLSPEQVAEEVSKLLKSKTKNGEIIKIGSL